MLREWILEILLGLLFIITLPVWFPLLILNKIGKWLAKVEENP